MEPTQHFVDNAQKYHGDSQASVRIKIEENEFSYTNTESINGSFPATAISIILGLSLIERKNLLGDYAGLNHTHPDEISWQDAEDRLFANIDRARANIGLSSGSYPVLFPPEAATDIKMRCFPSIAFKALQDQVSSISLERRWIGNLLLPYILLEDIYIAAKS